MNNPDNWKKVAIVSLASIGLALTAHGQSSDALIDKLVQKGILTVKEANELREETDKNFSQAYSVKSGMPDWVSALKFNGDFRARYEGHYFDTSTFPDRQRLRYRIRFGVTANLLDDFEIGLRLSSGDPVSGFGNNAGNPLSGSSTFQDNGSRKFIYLDLAYARWAPWNNAAGSAAFTFGKMEMPFVFSHLVFDPDYNPEGVAGQFSFNAGEKISFKLNGGAFVLDELSVSSDDPWLFGGQVRMDGAWTSKLNTSAGVAWLGISSVQNLNNANVPNVNRGNTRGTNGVLAAHFNPIIADASITYHLDHFPGYAAAFPIRIGGDFLYNPAVSDKNKAFSAGITLGKAGKRKLWELAYQYRYIEADAWYEEFPDDDFGGFYQTQQPGAGFTGAGTGYAGGTNVRGHFLKASYSPFDSLTFSLTYYYAWLLNPSPAGSDSGVSHVMADLVWKF